MHDWAEAIEGLRQEHDLTILPDCKQMARSVFYYHRNRLNSADKYKREKMEIKNIYDLHKGRYGYRRITAGMRNRGYGINHKTVQKLMGILELKCRIRKVRYRSYRAKLAELLPMCLKGTSRQAGPTRNGLRMLHK